MTNIIKFSIIMPFYNSADYIERAILSVINQTYDNLELIAINDGSLDDSLSIVEKYAKKDSRIRVITKENGGYSTAVNVGLENLSKDSDYFLLLGSDDALFYNVLSKLNDALEKEKFDLVGFRTVCVYSNGHTNLDRYSNVNIDVKETRTNIIEFYNKHNDIPQLFIGRDTSRIYKTSILENLRYFGKYGVSADGIFSMLFSYKCTSFAHLSIDGYLWYLRDNSVSSIRPNNLKKEDNFNNWRMFFTQLVDKEYGLTIESIKYINYFIYAYLDVVLIEDKSIFKRNKKNIIISKKLIKYLIAKFGNKVTFKNKLKISFPLLYRTLCKRR